MEEIFQTITFLFEYFTFSNHLLFFGFSHFGDSLPEDFFLFLNDSNLLMVVGNLLNLSSLLLGFFYYFKYKSVGLDKFSFIIELVFYVFSL